MSRRIRITAGGVSVEAELSDTATANLVWKNLPVSSRVNVGGEEIYFGEGIAVTRAQA